MRAGGSRPARAALGCALALGWWLSAAAAPAAPRQWRAPDLRQLASRAKEIRIERKVWDDGKSTLRTEGSAKGTGEWLGRLADAALPESGRWPETLCPTACRRCPDQLHVDVTFKLGKKRYSLSLYHREGLAFLQSDSAAAWSFGDSLGTVLDIVREGLPEDALTRAWQPPALRPEPPDPDSAAYREDAVLVTGMPEALKKVPPRYPSLAQKKGVSGVVHVHAIVAADGSIGRVRVSKSIPDLDQAALEAVREWKFKPGTCGGRAVPVWVSIPVRFTLR